MHAMPSDRCLRRLPGWRSLLIAAVLAVVFVTPRSLASAREHVSGEVLRLPVKTTEGEVIFVFRYCPQGVIKPGKPSLPDTEKPAPQPTEDKTGRLAAMEQNGIVSVDPFYLTETEVSIQQLALVLGIEQFKEHADRVKRGVNDPELLQHIDHKSASHPCLAVSLEEAVTFCQTLDQLEQSRTEPGRSPLERRHFRIPTHTEWQYACRAVRDLETAATLAHFNTWPESLEVLSKNTRADCIDEWKQMGRQEQELTGSQFQIAEIIEKRWATTNSKPLEILSALLRAATGIDRDFSKAKPGILRPLSSDHPNAWKLNDMHEGVREWTITIADRGEAQQFWDKLRSPKRLMGSDLQRPCLFLAGGSFADIMTGEKNAWMKFTIWGGAPFDPKAGNIRPFAIDKASEMASDFQPGLRVLLERVMAEDWLQIVRQQVVLPPKADPELLASLEADKRTIVEIVPQSKQKEVLAILDYYRALGLYRLGRSQEAFTILESPKRQLFRAKPVKKLDLSSLDITSSTRTKPAIVPKPSVEKTTESDDTMYLTMLQEMVGRDRDARK